jgi:hypothetical protein
VLASPQQPKTLRNIVIVTSVISLVFVLLSALWFWSIVLTLRPEAVISGWEKSNNEEINQELALKMIARLEHAIAINPLDANSHLLLARFYEILTHNEQKDKLNSYNKYAEHEYNLAVTYQASWDYAWSKQANFYSNQTVLNEKNFMYAISKAMLLGPYERKTQEVIIPLIFKHWRILYNNDKTQVQITKIIKNVFKYPIHSLLAINSAKKYHHLTKLLPYVTLKWQKNRLNKYLKEAANE